ncbi:MAG: DUF2059 domain-containing protein [Gammaproteobacteria bacterium]|nr:MAG: DUF2059 domain-containing protein [Gammaproteobacteria bacterium]
MKRLMAALCIMGFIITAQSYATDAAKSEANKKQMFRMYMEHIGGVAEYHKILGIVKQQTRQVMDHVLAEKNQLGKKISQGEIDQAVAYSIAELNQWVGKEMDQNEIIDNVFYPVHGSAYSEQDLQTILEFLNSDAGKKYTQQRNLLMRESFQILSEMYIPRMQEELVKIVQSEADKILKDK